MARGVNGLVERARRAALVLAHGLEAHKTAALRVVDEIEDLGGEHHGRALRREQAAGAILDNVARLEALAGVYQALPHMPEGIDVLAATKQQRLGHTARRLLADEARGHDARLIGDQQITGLEVVDDIVKMTMLDGAAMLERNGIRSTDGTARKLAVHHQEAAGITRLGGSLSDQLIGQVVIKIIGAHGATFHLRVRQPSMIAQAR